MHLNGRIFCDNERKEEVAESKICQGNIMSNAWQTAHVKDI